MVEKFIRWFFSEVNMYGSDIKAGIFGNYIIDKILGNNISNVDLFIYSDTDTWDVLKNNNIKHLEEVWNIFQYDKINIQKNRNFYFFNIYNVEFRIFCEEPCYRNIFTFQTLQYRWYNKQFHLEHNSKNTDPLFLLKVLNQIKRKKIIPLYPKNIILDHDYFLADREYYLNIVDIVHSLICSGWHFDAKFPQLHLSNDGDCSICRDNELHSKIKLQCGHTFHKNCLKHLMLLEPGQKHSNLCPNCRAPIQVFFS